MANETSSVRWQVPHSKVRRSNPRSPGEIRPKPILCLQVGHIGRSTVENELRISRNPAVTIRISEIGGLSGTGLSAEFCFVASQHSALDRVNKIGHGKKFAGLEQPWVPARSRVGRPVSARYPNWNGTTQRALDFLGNDQP
jgi:hypothetical protein